MITFKGLSVAKHCLRPERAPSKPDFHFPNFLLSFASLQKMMKMLFHLKSSFIIKIFKFLSWHFGQAKNVFVKQKKRLIRKIRLIFKFINVTTWLTNDCNTHLPNISRSKSQLDNEIWSGNRTTIYFFCKSCRKWARETRAAAWFQYISISLNLAYNKNNL